MSITCEIALRLLPQSLAMEINIGISPGTLRRQAITWTNIDPNICDHMASLSHDELSGQKHFQKFPFIVYGTYKLTSLIRSIDKYSHAQ